MQQAFLLCVFCFHDRCSDKATFLTMICTWRVQKIPYVMFFFPPSVATCVMLCVILRLDQCVVCKTGRHTERSPDPHHAVCGCMEYQCPAELSSLCACVCARVAAIKVAFEGVSCPCLSGFVYLCVCMCTWLLAWLIFIESNNCHLPVSVSVSVSAGQSPPSLAVFALCLVAFASQSSSPLCLPAVSFEVFLLSLLFLLCSHLVWSQWEVSKDCPAPPHCRAWEASGHYRPFTSL